MTWGFGWVAALYNNWLLVETVHDRGNEAKEPNNCCRKLQPNKNPFASLVNCCRKLQQLTVSWDRSRQGFLWNPFAFLWHLHICPFLNLNFLYDISKLTSSVASINNSEVHNLWIMKFIFEVKFPLHNLWIMDFIFAR